MVVVADTSPINYLILIDQIEILPRLYSRILIPPAVLEELKHPVAPESVRDWSAHPPRWLEVLTPKSSVDVAQLGPGESEAIALATEMRIEVLLIDELAGRKEATRRGLKVAGTLSVLDEADQVGLIDFDEAVARLGQTSFRVSLTVLAEIKHDDRADWTFLFPEERNPHPQHQQHNRHQHRNFPNTIRTLALNFAGSGVDQRLINSALKAVRANPHRKQQVLKRGFRVFGVDPVHSLFVAPNILAHILIDGFLHHTFCFLKSSGQFYLAALRLEARQIFRLISTQRFQVPGLECIQTGFAYRPGGSD